MMSDRKITVQNVPEHIAKYFSWRKEIDFEQLIEEVDKYKDIEFNFDDIDQNEFLDYLEKKHGQKVEETNR